MAKPNLSKMDIQSLMDLRKQVDEMLLERRAQIQKQLEQMDDVISLRTGARGKARTSALKGRKVLPKYRGPSGETWAGRGARPRWLVGAMKEGKKLDAFLTDKAATKRRKKRRSKR
jgi:DNA-binding protein H-NS